MVIINIVIIIFNDIVKECRNKRLWAKLIVLIISIIRSKFYCLTFINANSITVKFDNCKENYWTQIGTNVNLWILIANLLTAIAKEFSQTDY